MMTRVSTKCQQNLQLYKGNGSLFTNLLFAFFLSFLPLGSVFILQFEKLKMCFFKENYTETETKTL